MKDLYTTLAQQWTRIGPRFLPFADGASASLPLGRIIRLSLFQVSVGMTLVLLNGTLNRVMIVELGVASSLVAAMISIPILIAPMRLLLGHRSDYHRSYLGWRRVPYIWYGSMLQFGGLAIMPFALIVLSGDSNGPAFVGPLAAALAFLMVGAGMHTTQTAGLALADDLAEPAKRHRVVALLYVMLLIGSLLSALAFAFLLTNFSQVRLIQVIQGTAVLSMVLNMVALWKQEPRRPHLTHPSRPQPPFRETWEQLKQDRRCLRLMTAAALGTAAFAMQDILLEPFGGEILGLTVAGTTLLTALAATGTLFGLALAARWLDKSADPLRLASLGLLIGIIAFAVVVFAAPLNSIPLFWLGTLLIGLGTGLFAVGTLTAAMQLVRGERGGIVLGAWGTATALSSGSAILLSGAIRDGVQSLAATGSLGPAMSTPASGYLVVYHIEIALLFASLAAIGPLVGQVGRGRDDVPSQGFGLVQHPR